MTSEHYNHCYAIIALPCTWCGSEDVRFEPSLGHDIEDNNRIFGYGVICNACGKDSWSYVRFIDGHVKVTIQEHHMSFCSSMQPPRMLKRYELKDWSTRLGGSIKESSRACART